ncbi:MAG: methyltransferase [Treponema sp.]|jgi:23S rRNA G2445 N2-methylase RlmL|nr:methyltransferase [Treponema sp.]
MKFYATFIPGLRDCIAEAVRERLADAALHKLLDGAVLFETQCTYDTLNFFCFNNIFAVLDVIEQRPAQGVHALETHLKSIMKKALPPEAESIMAHNSKNIRSFRIVTSVENKPAAVNEAVKAAVEQRIARISGLAVNRSRPDAEFWFLYRAEGFSVFMKRLTLRPSWEKSLHPGELPPPLAWTLCRLGQLRHGDIVLDPFCGYGSIPCAALKYFHIKQCIACDHDKKAAAYTAARFKNRTDGSFILHKTAFHSLAALVPAQSVDAIITDPPWGHYAAKNASLYDAMFSLFDSLLKKNGRLVILGARDDAIGKAAAKRFVMRSNIPILLSGKKAEIFVFEKNA